MLEHVDFAGRQLGNYRLVRLLGQGGFAQVYLGEHIHLNTYAAVKLLHTRLANEDVENFRREAQTIARLIHPNIVRVLDFGVEQGAPYLVMDYAPNGTLRNHHPKGACVPLPNVISYVKQIAEALQYAHDQRLVHRDIKPENMLLGRNNAVLLSDFGIALVTQSSNYHNTQNVAGTIAYMAPEQIQAHPRPASDQYALGIVVYEWLTGNRPFQGSYTEIAVKHALAAPPPLRGQLPALPPAVENVVMIALQKDPQQRFPNVRTFAQALEQASQQRPSSQDAQYSATYVPPAPAISPSLTPWMGAPATSSLQTTTPPLHPSAPVYIPLTQQQTAMPSASSASSSFSQNSTSSVTPPAFLPPGNYPPSNYPPAYPTYPAPTSTPSSERQRSNLPRRAFIAGVAGLAAAAGSGLTWYFVSQKTSTTNTTPFSSGGNLSGNTNQSSTSTTNGTTSGSTTSGTPVLTYAAQDGYVWTVDWSPDGKYIASGSMSGTAHVWDATNPQKRTIAYRSGISPAISNNGVVSVAWSPDGRLLALGFVEGRTHILAAASGEVFRIYGESPSAVVYGLSWSPDGRYIACNGRDYSAVVYEVASGKQVSQFTQHTDFLLSLAWSPDGKYIVSGSSDGKVKVWEPMTGKELVNYTEHSDNVRSVAWSRDSKYIASASWDRTMQVWEAATGNTLYTFPDPGKQMMDAVAWSHNNKYLAVGSHGIYLYILNALNGHILQKISSYPAYGIAWSPNDSRLVTAGLSDNKVQVWQIT